MGHSVTIGGERVGSGNKNKIYLHNYERSTHNLSEKFTSTMGVGMLIPFMCIPATRDDKFEIDLSAGLRTIPTKGPLFGSFKLQLDVYQCPWRLYQALLHNNPLAIGLKANQVKFPKMNLYANTTNFEKENETDLFVQLKTANNSLVKYLGISGLGSARANEGLVSRTFTASHLLAYYDIFKNYYANKQEDNAYTLGHDVEQYGTTDFKTESVVADGAPYSNFSSEFYDNEKATIYINNKSDEGNVYIRGKFGTKLTKYELDNVHIFVGYGHPSVNFEGTLDFLGLLEGATYSYKNGLFTLRVPREVIDDNNVNHQLDVVDIDFPKLYNNSVSLKAFALKNIDDMRMEILSYHQLGDSFTLDGEQNLKAPYLWAIGNEHNSYWRDNLSGICVKTYQSDLFNNWINTEWIDGENGIAAITAISTSEGKITIDALNFSEKLYNLLNRIAVSGATYEDYLDAAYTDSAKKFCEAPMWIGGMSDEIVFEEIVQAAPTEDAPLGTLGGRGNLLGNHKGGKITVKVDEPSWIIGIVSITPRVQYTQGNMWYNTEIDSLQDIHVPALDGIGFQNLMAEQLLASSTVLADGEEPERAVIGKVPAWINYMTSFDKAYGDFANERGDGYMILNRNYEFDGLHGELKDATTYIDPAKFNYAFAYTKTDAQNFWVQIKSDIKARRLMSAKQIPNV